MKRNGTDPRSHRRYKELRTAYLRNTPAPHPCCLCGRPVDPTITGTGPNSPTIEHRIKVDDMRRIAQTPAELLDMVCDTSTWGLAHRKCNNAQGGRLALAKRKPTPPRPERDW